MKNFNKNDNKSGFGGKPKFEKGGDRNSFGNGQERQPRDGDWDCVKCKMNNFAFRQACKRCNAGRDGGEAPEQAQTPRQSFGGKPGDWICSQCSNDNFAFRTECKRCNAPKGDSEVVPGERGGSGGRGGFGGGRGRGNSRGGRGGFGDRGGRGGFGDRGRGGRGAGRGGFGDRKSFGGFDNNKSFEKAEPNNKKIKFDE